MIKKWNVCSDMKNVSQIYATAVWLCILRGNGFINIREMSYKYHFQRFMETVSSLKTSETIRSSVSRSKSLSLVEIETFYLLALFDQSRLDVTSETQR